MGSGKTTLGKKLALLSDSIFLDTDSLIEEQEQMSIASIFETRGEQYFRTQEYTILKSILTQTDLYCTNLTIGSNQNKNKLQNKIIIISLGGGTIQSKRIRKLLSCNKNKTLLLWLSCPLPIITQRLVHTNNRPLFNTFKNTGKLKQLYKRRLHLYKLCKEVTLYQNHIDNQGTS